MNPPAPTPLPTGNRPEIDGLRAIAVLAVILFHARAPGFGGGFLGVDVFFVISGFLITGLIVQDHEAGRFSLAAFWARRARRILPALLFMLLALTVPAMLLLTSVQRTDFLRTLAAAALSVSNIWLAHTTGYFDAPAEERPLLHTWSLGVEEQFYLLFPLAVAALWRFGRARLVQALALAALASFAWSEWAWRHQPGANFFLAPSRAWELLVGALAALAHARRQGAARWPSATVRELLAAAGLLAVIASVAGFDRSTPSPSAWCLAPVLGTAAVLLFAERGGWTARLLSLRLLVAIGLVSYSAYLWHQPLLVFGRLQGLEQGPWQLALLVGATFLVAAASWRWVEQPLRRAHRLRPARVLGVAAAFSGALALAGGAAAQSTAGKVPLSVLRAFEKPARVHECMDLAPTPARPDGWHCAINPRAEGKPSFIVYGDSHALQLVPAFEAAAAAAGRSGILAARGGCAPLAGTVQLTHPLPSRTECKALSGRVFRYAQEHGIRDAFLTAKWTYYTELSFNGRYLNALGLDEGEPINQEVSRRALAQGARNTARAAQEAGVRLRVFLQAPVQPVAAARVYEDAWNAGGDVAAALRARSTTRRQHMDLQARTNAAWREAGAVDLLDFTDVLCDASVCAVGTPRTSLYQDESHLSVDGVKLLVPRLTAILRAPPQPPGPSIR